MAWRLHIQCPIDMLSGAIQAAAHGSDTIPSRVLSRPPAEVFMSTPIRVLVAGCGNMGASHARAYHRMPEFEIVGLVSRGPAPRAKLSAELGGLPEFSDYYAALAATKPDAVSINTYPGDARARTRAPRSTRAATCSARSRWPRPWRRRSRSSMPRAREEPQAGDRLHPARAPGVGSLHRDGPHARQAAGDAHEPQPAEPRHRPGTRTAT